MAGSGDALERGGGRRENKGSRLPREFVPALPVELNQDQWKEHLTDFIQSGFIAKGMCADVARHDPDPPGRNPHANILLTVRPLNKGSTWQPMSLVIVFI